MVLVLVLTIAVIQCSHLANFFQQIKNFLEQGQIFSNVVNIALENLTNLWQYDI